MYSNFNNSFPVYKDNDDPNADLHALPDAPSDEDIKELFTFAYNEDYKKAFQDAPEWRKKEMIFGEHFRYPINLNFQLRDIIDASLRSAYVRRTAGEMNMPLLKNYLFCSPYSTGKRTTARAIQSLYPAVIIHESETLRYTQVPIIPTTIMCDEIQSLLLQIGSKLSEKLKNDMYYNTLVKLSFTKSMDQIEIWLKEFHVGLIIFDNIHLLLPKEYKKFATFLAIVRVRLIQPRRVS